MDDLRRPEAGFDCGECGQHVGLAEYHPFTYCVLHRAGVSIQQARDDLGAAAESQREALDVETLARAMQLADYGAPVRDHQGRRVAFDELQEPFQTMLRQGAASIIAALKEQPR